ncbi:MAG TPA: hypothetical protein VMB18_13070 [Terriglobales bacterium]|nr:hypothetical protein [Terriglobales bacterium]
MTNKLARIGLQWSLGLVLIYECARLLLSSTSRGHIPHALIVAIAAVELLGAILFLIPPTVKTGGRLLITTFVVAAIVHILHGQFDVGFLAIYGFAVLTVIP